MALLSLPLEVLFHVTSYLHAPDVASLCATCKLLHSDLDAVFVTLAAFYQRQATPRIPHRNPLVFIFFSLSLIQGLSALLGRDFPIDPAFLHVLRDVQGHTDFSSRLYLLREAFAPVFCVFATSAELCFGNCFSGETLRTSSSSLLDTGLHAVVDGRAVSDGTALTSSLNLLFALAKEHRRQGLCFFVSSWGFLFSPIRSSLLTQF